MNLPVLYRVDQPTSNVVVFRGAQVGLARQAGILAPTPPSAPALGVQSKASPTRGRTSTSSTRARGDAPRHPTYDIGNPQSGATGHRKVSDEGFKNPYYSVSWGTTYKESWVLFLPLKLNSFQAEAYYDWEYIVKDEHSNNDFGHKESRDGYNTAGQYFVLLPDGRLQTVTYTVDRHSGYIPIVEYTSKAEYHT